MTKKILNNHINVSIRLFFSLHTSVFLWRYLALQIWVSLKSWWNETFFWKSSRLELKILCMRFKPNISENYSVLLVYSVSFFDCYNSLEKRYLPKVINYFIGNSLSIPKMVIKVEKYSFILEKFGFLKKKRLFYWTSC